MADNTQDTATTPSSNPFAALYAQQQAAQQAVVPAESNPFATLYAQSRAAQPAAPVAAPSTPTPASEVSAPQNPFAALYAQQAPQAPPPSTTTDNVANKSYEDRYGVGESILSRPISTYFGIPEYREGAGGVEKGLEKFASSLTSPLSLGLMLMTGGTASIATAGGEAALAAAGEAGLAEAAEAGLAGEGAEAAATFGKQVLDHVAEKYGQDAALKLGQIAGTIDKVSTAGFALDQIRGFASQVPQIQSDLKDGDWEAAKEHITQASLGAVFAAASVNHLVTKLGQTKYNFTPDKQSLGELQGSIENSKLLARRMEREARPLLEKHAKEMTQSTGAEVSPHDLDVAMKWYHEAGGLQNEVSKAVEGEVVPKKELAELSTVWTGEGLKQRFGIAADAGLADLVTQGLIERDEETGHWQITSPEALKQLDSLREQGGHAGGGVASEEELSRPGKNYLVKKNGEITYHGKAFAPEETPNNGAHVTVLPTGEFRVNSGTLTDSMSESLKNAVKEQSEPTKTAEDSKVDPKELEDLKRQIAEKEKELGIKTPIDTIENLKKQREEIQNLDNISPKDKALMLRNIDLALTLPKELREKAESFRPFYKEHWTRAHANGLVYEEEQPQPNYAGNRKYQEGDETNSAFRESEAVRRSSPRPTKKPAQLKTRSFENMADALKKGYVPKQIGMVEAASDYHRTMGQAHGLVNAEKVLLNHTDTDGRPVAIEPSRIRNIPETLESGRTVERKGIRFDDASALDPDSERIFEHEGKTYLDVTDYVEGPKTFKRFRVTDVGFAKDETGNIKLDAAGDPVDLPVRRQTALMFHPDHIDRVNQAFDDSSWVRKTPWMNSVLNTSQFAKKTLLALSPFHYATEALRGLQTGLSLHEIFHPPDIDPEGIAATVGTKHGLVLLGDHAEKAAYRAAADSEASGGGGLISKIPYLRDVQTKAEEHLFGSWLPKMKAAAFERMSKDLQERNPNWSEHQVYTTAARLTNATFGGMNWKQLGVSANTVDVLRMIALAPDFTGSQIDYTMGAFKPGGSVVARSFGRMAMYNLLVAQAINLMIHGKPMMDHPFSVVSPDERKVWNMRTMPEDVWRSLTEPTSFLKNRLNPLVKTGIEELYGRNDEGKRLSDEQRIGELIRNVSPISLQTPGAEFLHYFAPDVTNKFKTGNQEDTFIQSLFRTVGVSPTANRTAAEKLASQRLNDRLPAGVSDPDQMDRHHKVLDAADQIRLGHSVDLQEFTPKERRQIMTAGREDLLRSKFGRLNAGDALDVWNLSTSEERKKLLPDLLKKSHSYAKGLSPQEREKDHTFQRLRAMGLAR